MKKENETINIKLILLHWNTPYYTLAITFYFIGILRTNKLEQIKLH